jgi:hypothetical protein
LTSLALVFRTSLVRDGSVAEASIELLKLSVHPPEEHVGAAASSVALACPVQVKDAKQVAIRKR